MGVNIVRDAYQHPIIGQYIHKVMFDELMETLNLPKDELKEFAEDVLAAKDLIWDEHGDLNTLPELTDMIACFLKSIQEKGMSGTVKGIL